MQWSEPAFILSYRPFGEHDARLHVFTREHGRFAGLVRGGQSSKKRHDWQPGRLINAQWRARLLDHLGSLTGESVRDFTAGILHQPLALAATNSCLTFVDTCTAERQPMPQLYDALAHLLPIEGNEASMADYVRFEALLLQTLGYGLDLSSCALTYTTHDLAYVSPKTGRAVSRDAAAPWADRLLVLPAFLTQEVAASWPDIECGLKLTGFFMERHLYANLPAYAQNQLMATRQRVLDLVEKRRKVAA